MTMPDPRNDLRAFAELSAALGDPFARRTDALNAAGVPGEDAFAELQAEWRRVFTREPPKRSAFQSAYVNARQERAAARRNAVAARTSTAISLSGEAAAPPLLPAPDVPVPDGERARASDPLDATAAVVVQRVLPVMPFVARDELGIPLHIVAATANLPAEHEDTGTVALPAGSASTKPVMPFDRPTASRSSTADATDDCDDTEATVFRSPSTKGAS